MKDTLINVRYLVKRPDDFNILGATTTLEAAMQLKETLDREDEAFCFAKFGRHNEGIKFEIIDCFGKTVVPGEY